MLNLLKKFRHQEIKSGRYLKYAIGEIFLVMIGILLALAINNWNNNRIQKKNARNYLTGMVEDLKRDSLYYQSILGDYRDQIQKKSQPFLNAAYEDQPIDSLFEYVISYYYTDRLSNITNEKLQNSGLSDILGNSQISEAINNYYTITTAQFKELMKFDREWSNTDNAFWLNNEQYEANSILQLSQKLPYMASDSVRKQGLISLINSTAGRNKLRFAINRKELGTSIIERSKKEATELIKLITTELEE